MIEQLFGSKTRAKLLKLFFNSPNRSFYVREITRKVDEQINSVRRELSNLLNVGIIKSETINNKLYYEVNQSFTHYKALSQIFKSSGQDKTQNETNSTKTNMSGLKSLGKVDLAVLTGKFTLDERSGVDLLLVGDLNKTQVDKYIDKFEEKEGREMRYTLMTTKEFNYRKKIKDRFIFSILESKKQVLIDSENLLETPKSPETDK